MPPEPELEFTAWYSTMFESLIQFMSALVLIPKECKWRSEKSKEWLHEALQRLQGLQKHRVGSVVALPPHGGGNAAAELAPHLRHLPSTIAQGLVHVLQRINEQQASRLQSDMGTCTQWIDAHRQMLAAFSDTAKQLQGRLRDDLTRVQDVATNWQHTVDRLLESQRERLTGKMERAISKWQNFCAQYAREVRAQYPDHAHSVEQGQRALMDGMTSTLRKLQTDPLAWWGSTTSLTSAIQHFLGRWEEVHQQLALSGGGKKKGRSHGRPDQDLELEMLRQKREQFHEENDGLAGQVEALEQDITKNRKKRHQMWLAREEGGASGSEAFLRRVSELDRAYKEKEQQLSVLSKMRQEGLRETQELLELEKKTFAKSTSAGFSGGENNTGSAHARWKQNALRFLPVAVELENQLFKFCSLSNRLIHSVNEVHDEVVATAMTGVQTCLTQLHARLRGELRRHLEQVDEKEPLKRVHRLEKEAMLLGGGDHAPTITLILEHHHTRWESDRQEHTRKFQAEAAASLQRFMGEDASLRDLLLAMRCTKESESSAADSTTA